MFSPANPNISSASSSSTLVHGPVSNIFVSVDPREIAVGHRPPRFSPSSNDVWIFEQTSKSGVPISAFLLLSQFGPNPKLVVDFVGRHLAQTILESEKLAELIGGREENLEEQVGQLVDEAFVRVDEKACEAIQERLLGEGEGGKGKGWMGSGCSALLALLLGHRLFVANLGGQMAIYCRDGEEANCISAICLNECQDWAAHCFGNFEAKLTGTASAHPNIHPQIELGHNARFLIFASPQVWRLFQRICPENQSLDGALANAVARAIYEENGGSSSEERIHELLGELAKTNAPSIPSDQSISLAIVDLRLDIFPKIDFSDENGKGEEEEEMEEEEGEEGDGGNGGERTVRSAVDWSEFETHHLKEEVLAKVDSLRQMYRGRRNLGRIHEDL